MALADRTLELVNIPSESRSEAGLYDYVRAAVPFEPAFDDGESVLFALRSGKPLVLLAGHTDTVPAQGNLPGRIEDDAVIGLGASDMKGGVAVMIELARDPELARLARFVFFTREEVPVVESPLPSLFASGVGQRLLVRRPKGRFVLDVDDQRTHLFVATGCGLAPFLAMVRTLLDQGQPRRACSCTA